MPRRERLDEYRRKRSFERTPEPAQDDAAAGDAAEAGGGPRFVIQEHSARSLHWDLRLEHQGALASWALPKGLPDDPDRNHLAVRTEDHPLTYLDFEGTIPEGEYGAGEMRIIDRGRYEVEKFEPAKVMVRLRGERATGRYTLFQTDGKNWLIHRMDPPEPGRRPLPRQLAPMLATLADRFPADEQAWAYEIKWDGVRALGFLRGGRLELLSRNGNEITARYPEVKDISRQVGIRDALLDGEIVSLDDDGKPSFQRLQRRMHVESETTVRRLAAREPVTYVVFDLLHLDGRSLLDLPYRERRRELEALGLEGGAWLTPSIHVGDGERLLAAARELGLEGVIAKRLEGRYAPGRRSREWLKLKNLRSQEMVIGGWVPGKGRRERTLGALLVGHWVDDDGGQDGARVLRYAGKVGTGFTDAALEDLLPRLGELETAESPFSGRQPQKDSRFVKPELVAEIEFTEWTQAGTLRQPSFKGLRFDKGAEEVRRERPEPPPEPGVPPSPPAATGWELAEGLQEIEGREVKLGNLDKVFYPRAGWSKGDVVAYYRDVAPALLPHLRGRPLTLKRYPDGVAGKHFYEKECPSWRPDWIRTAPIWSERKRREIGFCVIDDLPTLIWAANAADLEMHALLSRADDLERPTMMVFDLDPGPGRGLLDCARVGLELRSMLEQLGVRSLIKGSGSKGLQLHVPLNTETSFDQTGAFSQAIARLTERRLPELVVSKMTKERRRGKVLVDWSQNSAHKSTVVAFSLRARERPTVAVPLSWEEVEGAVESESEDGLRWEAARVLEDLERRVEIFEPLLELEQRLPDPTGE